MKPSLGIRRGEKPETNPGNARWCEEHGRLECQKNRSRGRGTCHGPAIKGTDACQMHCGFKREVAQVRGEAMITAWNATRGTAKIDYKMAVLGVLQMTWLRLAAYGELLRQQVAVEGVEPDPDGLRPDSQVTPNGLIGYRYGAAGKDGHIYPQSEEVRALVTLEAQERERVIKFAKTAHDMGISERLTNLAERWGDLVAARVTTMFTEMDLTPEQSAKLPELITKHLGSIDVESISGPKT